MRLSRRRLRVLIPPRPTLRALAKQLYELNAAADGPCSVCLARRWKLNPWGPERLGPWELCDADDPDIHERAGAERMPGDGEDWDGYGAARRLLADLPAPGARDPGFRSIYRKLPCSTHVFAAQAGEPGFGTEIQGARVALLRNDCVTRRAVRQRPASRHGKNAVCVGIPWASDACVSRARSRKKAAR